MSCNTENKYIGSIFGYNVYLTPKGTYSFGCGQVKISQKRMQNFLAELHKRYGKSNSQQEKDFEIVARSARRHGILIGREDVRQITNLFEKPAVPGIKKKVTKKK